MIRAEREARSKARQSLIGFTEYTFPRYKASAHHHLIAETLQSVARGEIDRLMISMPPRHGKSELATKRFPAWYLGHNPTHEIITASYNSDLAGDFGRDVRNIVGSRRFEAVFDGVSLADDSRAADRWHTNQGGAYAAVGVGGAATGRGANLLLIDDPHKDRKDADSETRRNDIWGWFQSTAQTRLMNDEETGRTGAIVVIQTRWHEDDLSGRLEEMEAKGGDVYHKLVLPAINDAGEALWPERYPIDQMIRRRNNTAAREWYAVYQQQPAPDDGTFFKRDWFEFYKPGDHPKGAHLYGSSDYAVSEDEGDYTAHGVWGLIGNRMYLVDGWYGQTESDKWVLEKIKLILRHRPLAWFGEGGVIQKAVAPILRRMMLELNAHCRMEWIPPIGDKQARARGFQAKASMGLVKLPDNELGHWFLEQLIKFPAGKNDDAVDVCSLMGRAIDEAHPGVAPIPEAGTKKVGEGYEPETQELDRSRVL